MRRCFQRYMASACGQCVVVMAAGFGSVGGPGQFLRSNGCQWFEWAAWPTGFHHRVWRIAVSQVRSFPCVALRTEGFGNAVHSTRVGRFARAQSLRGRRQRGGRGERGVVL